MRYVSRSGDQWKVAVRKRGEEEKQQAGREKVSQKFLINYKVYILYPFYYFYLLF